MHETRPPGGASFDANIRRVFKARRRLRVMAHPALYAAQAGRPELAADVRGTLAHFRASGRDRGLRVSALFHPRWYADRLVERGLEPARESAALFDHFLTTGWDLRIVPTPLFDEAHYLGRHPELVGRGWAFAHYAASGVYDASRVPSPFGRFHSGRPDPDARTRHLPLLMPSVLHRTDEHDLSRTSWLEEGVLEGRRRLAGLESPRVRALVAKAAAIEPLVRTPPEPRWAGVPPYVHPMLLTRDAAESVRRLVGCDEAATVVLAAAAAGGARGPELVLVAQGDGPAAPGTVDLREVLAPLNRNQRVKVLLDAVRGLRARRIVVANSELGRRLLETYARQLADQAELVHEDRLR
jgi:hypothetical protein